MEEVKKKLPFNVVYKKITYWKTLKRISGNMKNRTWSKHNEPPSGNNRRQQLYCKYNKYQTHTLDQGSKNFIHTLYTTGVPESYIKTIERETCMRLRPPFFNLSISLNGTSTFFFALFNIIYCISTLSFITT